VQCVLRTELVKSESKYPRNFDNFSQLDSGEASKLSTLIMPKEQCIPIDLRNFIISTCMPRVEDSSDQTKQKMSRFRLIPENSNNNKNIDNAKTKEVK
jgi:hypothetical protein